MLKTILAFSMIILDVMILPFSCFNQADDEKYVFVVQIEDEEHDEFYDFYSRAYDLNQDYIVQRIPEEFLSEVKEGLDNKYEIKGWYSLASAEENETHTLVNFPFKASATDFTRWQNYRHAVVFYAEWVYIGNATNL